MSRSVLVVEDDTDIAELIRLHLGDLADRVEVAANGLDGLARARREAFDLVILDLMLPGLDGLEVCKAVRAGQRYTPILMLTARGSETDRVVGLELGADDYLTKPFSVRELVARVKAIFRRLDALSAERHAPAVIERSGMTIDTERHTVEVEGRPISLTSREFDLLVHFASYPGRVFRRAQLLDHVWGAGYEGYEHTVNSHINRLRAKIERDPAKPRYILTVWGIGYKFTDD
ncbi:MAG: response regulator transcription factor [Gammaproteobacteria bacterium]|nr:response regulator transcription factor [Gammaproteobacteria bacterium]